MEAVIILSAREKAAAQSFHLTHVRSLLRPITAGRASSRLPSQAEPTYRNRARGTVTVVLPGGDVSTTRAFEALCEAEVPQRHLAHAVLNGSTHWFPCSEAEHCPHSNVVCFRAHFRHGGKWLFFFTEGAPLPFGAVVSFSKSFD